MNSKEHGKLTEDELNALLDKMNEDWKFDENGEIRSILKSEQENKGSDNSEKSKSASKKVTRGMLLCMSFIAVSALVVLILFYLIFPSGKGESIPEGNSTSNLEEVPKENNVSNENNGEGTNNVFINIQEEVKKLNDNIPLKEKAATTKNVIVENIEYAGSGVETPSESSANNVAENVSPIENGNVSEPSNDVNQ